MASGSWPSAGLRSVHATLPAAVQARLVVENDDRLFPLRDCLHLHQRTGVPILFDNFHHECLNHGEPMAEALRLAAATWHPTADGVPMMDYSSQALGERKGKHTDDMVDDLFRDFLTHLHGLDFDIMLEIKNKEASALRAVAILRELGLSAPCARPAQPAADPAPRPHPAPAETQKSNFRLMRFQLRIRRKLAWLRALACPISSLS